MNKPYDSLDQHFDLPQIRTVGRDRPLQWLRAGWRDRTNGTGWGNRRRRRRLTPRSRPSSHTRPLPTPERPSGAKTSTRGCSASGEWGESRTWLNCCGRLA